MTRIFRRAAAVFAPFAAALLLAAIPSVARAAQARITAPIDNANRVTIAGSRPGMALAANDAGKLAPDTRLEAMSFVFNRSAAQQADLDTLIAAQQNPASSLYHQWLTPDQFAVRFGAADADIAKVQVWLQQQGFTLNGVSRSRNRITFSGTAAQVASAFGAEIHTYKSGTETHFAPATDLTVPAELGSVVATIGNVSNFRPHPHMVKVPPSAPKFTSSQSGNHFLTPKDVATIYDINAAYNAGYTGSNQSIAIMGESFVYVTDITTFQTAAGLTPKAPTFVLVPNSGAATVYDGGDEAESDLDLEYSSGIATGANIFFVYTGSSTNYDVFDSLQYAVSERIAPIISISYGVCEPGLSSSDYTTLNAILAQAAAQGQSVISAAGDAGSTDCFGDTDLDTTTQESVAVDFPASSQYVTGLGGTEFPTADTAAGNNTYFAPATNGDVVSSALSYIPEQVWNDDAVEGTLASGGGGVSIYTPRPSWQTGVTGIASGIYRLVPDISLDSSAYSAPYAFCSSDTYAYNTGQVSSCTSGLRDSSTQDLTIAGGTSFAAPIFAGMLAIINQKTNSTGQGLINPTLYSLASNSTTYASAFHDITSGSNECLATADCTSAGAAVYPATTGYDEASGIGSVDLNNLLNAWPATATSGLASSTVTLSAANTSPAVGASDVITITVTATTGNVTPTGTVAITVDGVATTTLPLTGGTTTYTASFSTAGAHVIVATYSGDTVFAGSTASIVLNVGVNGFSLTATNITETQGTNGATTVTVTPNNGYTGTVDLTLSSTANLSDACYAPVSVAITGSTPVAVSIPIYTSEAACNSQGLSRFTVHTLAGATAPARPGRSPFRSAPLGAALAGLFALGCFRKRARRLGKLQSWLVAALLMAGGLGLSGCSDTGAVNSTLTQGDQAKGTYTITVTGTDATTSAITATANFTLTLQ